MTSACVSSGCWWKRGSAHHWCSSVANEVWLFRELFSETRALSLDVERTQEDGCGHSEWHCYDKKLGPWGRNPHNGIILFCYWHSCKSTEDICRHSFSESVNKRCLTDHLSPWNRPVFARLAPFCTFFLWTMLIPSTFSSIHSTVHPNFVSAKMAAARQPSLWNYRGDGRRC